MRPPSDSAAARGGGASAAPPTSRTPRRERSPAPLTSRSSIVGTRATCAPSGASASNAPGPSRSGIVTREPVKAPRNKTSRPPMCAGLRHATHGSYADASSASSDLATAAPMAGRDSCARRGTPPVPLVGTIAPAVSGSTGAASARIVSSSGRTTTDGRARSSSRRCSPSDSRTSTGMNEAPECTCAAKISSQWNPGGSAYATSSPGLAHRCAVPSTWGSLTIRVRALGVDGHMVEWHSSGQWTDIRYETAAAIAKITIDRPDVRNAFRPLTTKELIAAFEVARDDPGIGVVILTGEGPEAFSSGGDQKIRGDDGYVDEQGIGRLNVLDLQVQIRRFPKPVIAMVAGYAIGGGHVLHLCCDLTIAADNARCGETGPRVGSFDGGYGIGLLARQIGEKRAKEVWFLCRQYDAATALDWGLVNAVVPLGELEATTLSWADELLEKSPLALRLLKSGYNAGVDGLAGVQHLAGDATLLYYMSEEAQEGRDAFKEKRTPDFSRFPKRP